MTPSTALFTTTQSGLSPHVAIRAKTTRILPNSKAGDAKEETSDGQEVNRRRSMKKENSSRFERDNQSLGKIIMSAAIHYKPHHQDAEGEPEEPPTAMGLLRRLTSKREKKPDSK